MDLNQMQARQPDFQQKNKNNNTKAFMPLNLVLGLHMLLANPKPGVASFATSLIMFHKTATTQQDCTTQQTRSLQPLPYKAKADKIHQEFFIYFLESREELGVV